MPHGTVRTSQPELGTNHTQQEHRRERQVHIKQIGYRSCIHYMELLYAKFYNNNSNNEYPKHCCCIGAMFSQHYAVYASWEVPWRDKTKIRAQPHQTAPLPARHGQVEQKHQDYTQHQVFIRQHGQSPCFPPALYQLWYTYQITLTQTHMNRKTVYIVLSALAPIAVASLLILLSLERYHAAFVNALLIVGIMESRIQTSTRLPRARLFYAHIISSVFFLVSLFVVSFITAPQWLIVSMWASVTVEVYTGSILWYRGIKRTLSN